MSSRSSTQSLHATRSSPADSGSRPDLVEQLRGLERELRAIVHDVVHLAALETRRAGESLVRITAMGFLVALLVCSAWLSVAGWAGILLVENNVLSRDGAMLCVAAVNALVALFVIALIRRESRNLLMAATVHFLKPADRGKEE